MHITTIHLFICFVVSETGQAPTISVDIDD